MKSKTIFLVSVLIFAAAAFFLPTNLVSPEQGNVILTVSTFLFGIFAGFCILVTTNDYNIVRALAADETSAWISLYQTIRIYNEKFAQGMRPIMETYIIRSFDYDFINYARETKQEFAKATEYLVSLPVDEKESSVHQNILDRVSGITLARQHLTALGKRSLTALEWIVLLVLALTVIAAFYGLRSGGIFFDVVAVAVSASIVLVLVLIRDIDRYVWNDGTFSFEIFNNVLLAIGAVPYYPAEFVRDGTVVPNEKIYRLGHLVNPGRSWERRIEMVEKN